jgi:ribosome recycling factor
MVDKIISGVKEKMEKTTEYFRQELKGIRTGRATLTVFENIKVNYYGTLAPISTIATLHIADPHMITIGPWDTSIIKDIEKAILSSNLGFNPSNDCKWIRVPVPSITE